MQGGLLALPSPLLEISADILTWSLWGEYPMKPDAVVPAV